jgi:hypothetical protein
VAQRIAWTNGWSILFTGPTVRQLRNDYQLMRDFRDELPGYLNNRRIGELLESLNLRSGPDRIHDNLRICYEALVREAFLAREELAHLDAWLCDLSALQRRSATQ